MTITITNTIFNVKVFILLFNFIIIGQPDISHNIYLSNINIYSLFGNEIQLNIKSITENNIEFDISSLPQGVYFVNVMIGGKVERMKFVKLEN